ncbi:PilZ domain-containing protein [Bradyrhizobium sp. RDM4]|uniref:PilZ domain-containing protein n=1 Tax=Bradyrhizobium sp. RDM4 TaxID=3378765 RepID=UPI0038FCA5A3
MFARRVYRPLSIKARDGEVFADRSKGFFRFNILEAKAHAFIGSLDPPDRHCTGRKPSCGEEGGIASRGMMTDERRRVERNAVIEIAYIFGDGSSIRCCVINISEHGAAIELPEAGSSATASNSLWKKTGASGIAGWSGKVQIGLVLSSPINVLCRSVHLRLANLQGCGAKMRP